MGRKFVQRAETRGEWNRTNAFCVVLFGKKKVPPIVL